MALSLWFISSSDTGEERDVYLKNEATIIITVNNATLSLCP